jgi:hypothetical protein
VGKRLLPRPRHRQKDNIEMDIQEVGGVGMGWIDLAQDRGQVVGTCECSNEPSGSIPCDKFLTNRGPVSFTRKTMFH